ncbi:hypothetical protein IWX85_003863 [Polaromonas sp. CG_9.11]|nr:hypothetical protein [Polaromonas sp. CG_9.11]
MKMMTAALKVTLAFESTLLLCSWIDAFQRRWMTGTCSLVVARYRPQLTNGKTYY